MDNNERCCNNTNGCGNCDSCDISAKFILIGTLALLGVAALIIGTMFLLDGGTTQTGAIIPFSSGSTSEVVLATLADGSPEQVAFMAFGNAEITSPDFVGGNIGIIDTSGSGEPWDTAFIVPRDGILTSIGASFTTANQDQDAALAATNLQITARLYSANVNSTIYYALPGAEVNLTPILNGTVPPDTILSGFVDGLSIPVSEDTKLLLVFYASSPVQSNQVISGFANAGINIR